MGERDGGGTRRSIADSLHRDDAPTGDRMRRGDHSSVKSVLRTLELEEAVGQPQC